MSTTFTTAVSGPMVIEYCDETFAGAPGSLMQVVARIDGVDVAPGATQLDGDSDENQDGKWARDHCFRWIAAQVPVGTHTVGMYWMSFFGDVVYAHGRSMVVRYKK